MRTQAGMQKLEQNTSSREYKHTCRAASLRSIFISPHEWLCGFGLALKRGALFSPNGRPAGCLFVVRLWLAALETLAS